MHYILFKFIIYFISFYLSNRIKNVHSQNTNIKIMTFNLRTANANDHNEARWDKRAPRTIETIKKYFPDLIGTQETTDRQLNFL